MDCPYCGEGIEPRLVTSEHLFDGPGWYCPECFHRLPDRERAAEQAEAGQP